MRHSPITTDLRTRLFNVIWNCLLPARAYLRAFPLQRGKGLLLRGIVKPLLPPAGTTFFQPLPAKASIQLQYRETLGLHSLIYGLFEKEELNFVASTIRSGQRFVDVGANSGLFTLVAGKAVGPAGEVLSFEPITENISRIRENTRDNGLENVKIYELALGSSNGMVPLNLAEDTVYSSIFSPSYGTGTGQTITVSMKTFDEVWVDLDRPSLAMMKVDVEGAEMEVLRGARSAIAATKPILLIEANSAASLEQVQKFTSSLNYCHVHASGFSRNNHLFFPTPGS